MVYRRPVTMAKASRTLMVMEHCWMKKQKKEWTKTKRTTKVHRSFLKGAEHLKS